MAFLIRASIFTTGRFLKAALLLLEGQLMTTREREVETHDRGIIVSHTIAPNNNPVGIVTEREVRFLPMMRKRSAHVWQPTDRERAILSLPPGLKNMGQYCQSLDEKKVPFPKEWQRKGLPKSHVEAWDSKDARLQNLLKSERNNVWNKVKKGLGV
jgi:hypothetical protein